jgi:MerR HTH family regulatory protein
MTLYPGSKMRQKDYDKPVIEVPDHGPFDKTRLFSVKGREVEFYATGVLAEMLNRESGTIRKWESEGVIPKATFIAPSDDKRGKRRLYTRAQIEGIRKIAAEEGVLEPGAGGRWKSIRKTDFREKVYNLFTELAKEFN